MASKKTIKTKLENQLRFKAFGNTGISYKEICSDYCNSIGRSGIKEICNGTFLTRHTIERIMDCDDNYRPQDETIRRIMVYFGLQAEVTPVRIQSKYRNQPKNPPKE